MRDDIGVDVGLQFSGDGFESLHRQQKKRFQRPIVTTSSKLCNPSYRNEQERRT